MSHVVPHSPGQWLEHRTKDHVSVKKKNTVTQHIRDLGNWTDKNGFQPRNANNIMRIGTWNIRSLYRQGAAKYLAEKK